MKTYAVTSNQDGDAGEFSRHGACATPINAKEENHAPTFGHVLAGCMADMHRRYATESGQDEKHPDVCQTAHLREVGKR